MENLLHHLQTVLSLVLPNLDVVHLHRVRPHMSEIELGIAEGTGSNNIVFRITADLQATHLNVPRWKYQLKDLMDFTPVPTTNEQCK